MEIDSFQHFLLLYCSRTMKPQRISRPQEKTTIFSQIYDIKEQNFIFNIFVSCQFRVRLLVGEITMYHVSYTKNLTLFFFLIIAMTNI